MSVKLTTRAIKSKETCLCVCDIVISLSRTSLSLFFSQDFNRTIVIARKEEWNDAASSILRQRKQNKMLFSSRIVFVRENKLPRIRIL